MLVCRRLSTRPDRLSHLLLQGSGLFSAAAAGIATLPRARGVAEQTAMEEEDPDEEEDDGGGGRDMVSYDDI